jgi:hypothetical protein
MPTVRIGGFLCFGGYEVDAIMYYSKQAEDLKMKTKGLREKPSIKTVSYGWIVFKDRQTAHTAAHSLKKHIQIKVSPSLSELIWLNLSLNEKERMTKRWLGHGVYLTFISICMILISALSAGPNMISLIRLIPGSRAFMDNN